MSAILLTLGVYLLYSIALIIGLSFNTNLHFFVGDRSWGLDNWRLAFADPKIFRALWNTVWLFFVAQAVSFPLSIFISWLLGRTRLPWAHTLELFYWVSYVTPGGLLHGSCFSIQM